MHRSGATPPPIADALGGGCVVVQNMIRPVGFIVKSIVDRLRSPLWGLVPGAGFGRRSSRVGVARVGRLGERVQAHPRRHRHSARLPAVLAIRRAAQR